MKIHETFDLLEEVPADILVLFHLADEPAPRGRLGRVDWILGSAVSRLRARGKFAGERGASALLSPNHKIKAERILVCGLGHQADLSMPALYRLSYQAAHTILNLRCVTIALELPFRAFPLSPPHRIRHAFLEGFQAELRRGRPDAPFAITLLPPEDGSSGS
jgi:Cytosol aminopeptidase family, N-terminal domain